MSNEKKSYSNEFKAKVVLEAVSGEHINPHEVAEKYDVSPAQIVSWAHELNISDINLEKLSASVEGFQKEPADDIIVEIETESQVFESEVAYGATYDIINMRLLTFWAIFGSLFIAVTIMVIFGLFNFGTTSTIRSASERSEFYEIQEMREQEVESLSSFGIVDLENRVFRMPIDTVISRMAQDEE